MQRFIDYLNQNPITRGTLNKNENSPPCLLVCDHVRWAVLNQCDRFSITTNSWSLVKGETIISQYRLIGQFDYKGFLVEILQRDKIFQQHLKLLTQTTNEVIYQVYSENLYQNLSSEMQLAHSLIDCLAYEGENDNWKEIKALSNLSLEQAFELLETTLKVGDESWRVKTPFALGRLILPLRRIVDLENSDLNFSQKEINRIRSLIDRLLSLLIECLESDKNESVKAEAARVLGFCREINVIPPLLAAFSSKSVMVRIKSAEALGHLGIKQYGNFFLLKNIEEKDKFLFKVVIDSGFTLDVGQDAFSLLLNALKGEQVKVQSTICIALGLIGDDRAVQPLIEMLQNDDIEVRENAVTALGLIGHPAAVNSLLNSLSNDEKEIKIKVIVALDRVKSNLAIAPLSQIISDNQNDIEIIIRAVEALWHIGTAEAIEPLMIALNNPNPDVRYVAVLALSQLGDLQVFPMLQFLRTNDKSKTSKGMSISQAAENAINSILLSQKRK